MAKGGLPTHKTPPLTHKMPMGPITKTPDQSRSGYRPGGGIKKPC